ncbi:hypothetical protein [Geodermatophilus sp. SYSU D01119]
MIDMRFALAPAGVAAPGGLDVRPAGCGVAWKDVRDAVLSARPRYAVVRSMTPFDLTGTAVAAPTAPFQGTGLPTGLRGTEQFAPAATVLGGHRTDIDNSTTLGIHSPGRPQS